MSQQNTTSFTLCQIKLVLKSVESMRLGDFTCKIDSNSRADLAYGANRVAERHRHRFEFSNKYREQLKDAGLVISGINPKKCNLS
jgi:CTP synthase (UTP-ammonia lyase)